ncbi:MAG: efflux RND transporter periplasmic adaptor subunit [Bdellovibrionales bacterium]
MTDKNQNQTPEKSHILSGIFQLVLVLVFIVASFAISNLLSARKSEVKNSGDNTRALTVETQTLSPGPFSITFKTTGIIKSRAQVNVTPQITGRATYVNENFFAGGTFDKGDIVFKIDPRDFELEVERLQAQIVQAKTNLDLEKAESAASLAEWQQFNGDKPAPPLVSRQPQMAEARATLNAAKAQLETAKLALERSQFSLPFNGRVIESDLAEGQLVTAGQSYGSVFDVESLEVEASLEDRQLEWLSQSQNPDVTITATYLGQSKNYAGTLKRGASALDAQTRFASVTFGFKDKAPDLVPGIFTTITVKGPTLQNITVLPPEALQKEDIIWTVSDDQTLTPITADILYADDTQIAVSGLDKAYQFVTSRVSGATTGTKVTIREQSEPLKDPPDEE